MSAAELAQMRIALPPMIDPSALRNAALKDQSIYLEGRTMGTLWRLRARVPLQNFSQDGLRASIEARLDEILRQMSHWDGASDLCRFNKFSGGQWSKLAPDFAKVMTAALALADVSGGAFSPSMGRLVNAWGFGPNGQVDAPPTAHEVAGLLPLCDARRLAIDDARLRQPGGIWLDLSGIAKGYAVDALAQLLRMEGVHHGLVEVGGELMGWGVQGNGQPWWVDLENPPRVALHPLRIALHELAVATSGTYIRGGHNLDPADGYPAASGVLACSVIHASAMIADGWASAMSVLGPEKGLILADQRSLAVRWVMQDGSERLSATLYDMIAN
jgi:thiamine biosynthesis lipoprotein